MRNQDLVLLERFGLVMPGVVDYLKMEVAHDEALAYDAQPQLATTTSGGIPAYFANFVSPKLIDVVFAPMRGGQLQGETKTGDWTTLTATFPMIEATGETSSYGDYNNNGSVNLNPDFPTRQSYHFQTVTSWGERQLEMAGLAKIQWAAKTKDASGLILNKFMNQSYFYGIGGLENYGWLNDPNLPPAITASVKAYSTGASGTSWEQAEPTEICNDVINAVNQLRRQTGGNVENDAPMVIGLSPTRSGCMSRPNTYGLTAAKLVKDIYPNLEIVEALEYGDALNSTTQIMQVMLKELNGQEVGTASFTEKLRSHQIVPGLSSWQQKQSGGTWGAIVWVPAAIVTMVEI